MKTPSTQRKRVTGFALVITVSLMVILTVIAVGLLTLSTVAMRTSSIGAAQARARANARMALMMAIDKLQTEVGPDQKITANGAILDPDPSAVRHPHWTGVWNSWKAEPLTANGGSPVSAHQTIEGISSTDAKMRPDYDKSKSFSSWLVSLDPQSSKDMLSAKSLNLTSSTMPSLTTQAVKLVAEGTLGKNSLVTDHVAAPLVSVLDNGQKQVGRYGWWVGDESQKSMMMDDSYKGETLTAAQKIFRQQAASSTGTSRVTGLENIGSNVQFDNLPSLKSLDLMVSSNSQATVKPSEQNFHHITTNSYGVLADVREGGLKRDLNTILEQPINLANNGDEYMLYAFDDPRFPYQNNPNDAQRANSRVPIQDLAAYYQLYDHQPTFANGRREGVQYSSGNLPNSLQINVPDYDGGSKNQKLLNREYTSLYRRPVVTKVQFLVGVTAQEITQAERDQVQDIIDKKIYPAPYTDNPNGEEWRKNLKPIRPSDTYRLRLGIQPLVTLWNPNNLPLVMNSKEILTYNAPPFGIQVRKYRASGGTPFDSRWMNLGYANDTAGGTSAGQASGALLKLRLANSAIVFEPGEVKVFSLPSSSAANLTGSSNVLNLGNTTTFNVVNEWDPFGVFLMRNSAPAGHHGDNAPDVFTFTTDNNAQCLVFGPNDGISISIDSENASTATVGDDGRTASRSAEIEGAGFSLYMFDEGYIAGHWSTWADALRHEIMISRHGSQNSSNQTALGGFYQELMRPGFPGGVAPIQFDTQNNAFAASEIIGSIARREIIAIMDFSLSIGCEASSPAAGGFNGGRRVTNRPFLHSATSALPFISQSDKASLYDYGWDWQVSKIDTVEDSILEAEPATGNGYYGGGYTVELGTTHIIQREIPVLPPISIASLSHAELGGFSMAKAIPVGENPDTDKFWFKDDAVKKPTGVSFQRVTASGQNGLAPHIVQAIGNSYAHPNIPAAKAFVTKQRIFDLDEGSKNVPFVDHSYLANKALWDEYFFSSITPQLSKVELYGSSTNLDAKKVAENFFFNDKPLPNRQLIPYSYDFTQKSLDDLFAQASSFSNGTADKIASRLMLNGAFNVNSTSVEAWKVFLSSLRGKPIAYLPSGKTPLQVTPNGTVFGASSLPNQQPVLTSSISAANIPPEQWTTSRELTDAEIDQLSQAMVTQVKLRGPFLSLSEFVNRRLEGDSPPAAAERSVKGALQAALDDPNVSINQAFNSPDRKLDAETASIPFQFPKAATGPIAYGSSAYVDQADILRSLGGRLTPRGDTFVIRAYGDSLDAKGNVEARAWCEAIVQRTPEYVDPKDPNNPQDTGDAPERRQVELTSPANQNFGRKFKLARFRWLSSNEI